MNTFKRYVPGSPSKARTLCQEFWIQLANPLDISAEFFVQLVRDKDPESRSRYVLHADARTDSLLDGATKAKARFRAPTLLTD